MESNGNEVELRQEVARLATIVDELRGRVDQIDTPGESDNGGQRSRRDLLKVAGAAVAGAAGAVLLGAQPVAATDGNALILGNTDTTISGGAKINDAGATTNLTATSGKTPSPMFQVIGPGATVPPGPPSGPALGGVVQSIAPAQASGGPTQEGVDGWAPGNTGAGVAGYSDSGYGVLGQTSSGVDLAAYGSGRLYQFSLTDNTGNPLAGPPAFTPAQPPNLPGGELMRDANSVLWASNAAGTLAAAWRRMNTLRFDKADGSNALFQPVRVVDTRPSGGGVVHQGPYTGPLGQGFYDFPLAGANGIPSDAIGVVGNLTAVAYSIQGYLAIFPKGAVYTPGSSPSSLNYAPPAYAWANSFIVGLGTGGAVTVYVFSSQHIIIDLVAYFQ